MKNRIKLIMEKENLTPAKFADRLQINRAIVSHILSGRNNPSLDVVTRILSEMNYIQPEWLLNGTGRMYKEGIEAEEIPREPDLFNQQPEFDSGESARTENGKETELKETTNHIQHTVYKTIDAAKAVDRKITQIIIYYNDNTFETFIPPQAKG